MARPVGSFLMRLWRTGRSQRIEIEHIQSGEKGLVTSVADAIDWINVRTDDPSTLVDAELDDTHAVKHGDPDAERRDRMPGKTI
jgi:hypothetical protein